VLELQTRREAGILHHKYNVIKIRTERNYTQKLITELVNSWGNLKEQRSVGVKQVYYERNVTEIFVLLFCLYKIKLMELSAS
jgi:hypothetical protein